MMKSVNLLIILSAILILNLPLEAQNRVSQPYYEYFTDADGNRHGTYKKYFDIAKKNISYIGDFSHGIAIGVHKSYKSPGVIAIEITYSSNGKEQERKYYDKIKKLGNYVRGLRCRELFNNNGDMIGKWEWDNDAGKMIQVRGELADGKGLWSQVMPKEREDRTPLYTEWYFNNDTTYTWYGYKDNKLSLQSKSAPNYLRRYDENGNITEQYGNDFGVSSAVANGKINYVKTVDADKTTEEWDEDGTHYSKGIYPDFGINSYKYESLEKKGPHGYITIYQQMSDNEGESARIEYEAENGTLKKYVLYHNGNKVLTYYILHGFSQIMGQREPIFSYYNLISDRKPSYKIERYKDIIIKARSIFPQNLFNKFEIGRYEGDLIAMIDANGNWLISPYFSKIPQLPNDDDFSIISQEIMQIASSVKDYKEYIGFPKCGYSKINNEIYLFPTKTGTLTPLK